MFDCLVDNHPILLDLLLFQLSLIVFVDFLSFTLLDLLLSPLVELDHFCPVFKFS